MTHNYYVYIMTNKPGGVLYVGVANDLMRRVSEHRNGENKKSFTYRYNLKHLVFYQHFTDVNAAIYFEKQLKRWQRPWKDALIKEQNPEWQDLWEMWLKEQSSWDPGSALAGASSGRDDNLNRKLA